MLNATIAAMKPDGGPAYRNLTVRDHFAAAVAPTVLRMAPQTSLKAEHLAAACYQFADALLAERGKS